MAENIHAGHRKRMYEKYDEAPFESFPDHEILEMLLFYVIPQMNTNNIAHTLLDRFGSLKAVLNAPVCELECVHRMGRSAARYLNMWSKTFDRITKAESKSKLPKKLNHDTAVEFFKCLFEGKTREEVYMICLDPTDNILLCEKVSEGSFESARIDAPKAARAALNCDSKKVVFAHNHPSGIFEASNADINTTRMLEGAFFIMGIDLRDHVIYTKDRCVSIMNEYHIRRDRSLTRRGKKR